MDTSKEWNLPVINPEQCTRCGICVADCPEDALEMTAKGAAFKNPESCTFCTTCEEVCPAGAVRCEFEVRW
jgi:ferredoxin